MIAREKEQKELNDAFNDERAQFVAVYGRRRIGKTFLVKETFEGRFSFRHTGLANADKKQQIAAFKKSLKKTGMRDSSPIKDWYAAFDRLEELVEAMPEGRKVIFLDEVPWMDTGRCEFVSADQAETGDCRCVNQSICLVRNYRRRKRSPDRFIDRQGGQRGERLRDEVRQGPVRNHRR